MKFLSHVLLSVVICFSSAHSQAMSQTVPKGTSTYTNTAVSLPSPRLHLVGDSTMADKMNLAYPERGWGQLLPAFMLEKTQHY